MFVVRCVSYRTPPCGTPALHGDNVSVYTASFDVVFDEFENDMWDVC